MFEVKEDDISRLKDTQLVELLRRLLLNEAYAHNLPRSGVHVAAKINVPDGGEDGRCEWENGPEKTDYIPKRFSIWQVKAKSMADADCTKEVKKKVKGQITNTLNDAATSVIEKNGAYIVFCNKHSVGQNIDKKVAAIKKGFSDCSSKDSSKVIIDYYDSNKIMNWVNCYPSVVIWVHSQLNSIPLELCRPWSSWERDAEHTDYTFEPPEGFKKQQKTVLTKLSDPRSVIRMTGHSGLGKTRRALEFFREEKVNNTANIESRVIYINAACAGKEEAIKVAVALLSSKSSAIYIVDDCSAELHKQLATIARNQDSKFSLLTLDYDLSRIESTHDTEYIDIEELHTDGIEKILEQSYPNMDANVKRKITNLAQGYPLLAVLLGEADLAGEENIGQLNDDDLRKRMILGRDASLPEDALKILKACSLFDFIGIDGNVANQLNYVAEKIASTTPDDAYRYIQQFTKKRVVQRRGDYIQVRPKPLAIRLAAEKWSETRQEQMKQLFYEEDMPDGLLKPMCDQLRMLDFIPQAKIIVKELCGECGPFGNAEVLNTDQGSRIFRSLVEVNPEATADCLFRCFGNKSTEELLTVKAGRRDLVWALEKLCCRISTFPKAARVLFAFATAENESWGNNATNQFAELFQLFLSGTEATPEMRFKIIDEVIAKNEEVSLQIVLKALESSIGTDHFSRVAGAETQGSTYVLQPWTPKTYGDRWDYFRMGLSRLTDLGIRHDKIGEDARNIIASHMRGLIRQNLVDDVEKSAHKVCAEYGYYWPDAIENINHSLIYDAKEMPDDYVHKINKLRELFSPKSIEERVKLYISELPWDAFETTDFKESKKLSKEKAIEIAKEVQQSNKFFEVLPSLLTGEQRNIFDFCSKIIEMATNPEDYVKKALKVIESLPKDKRNYALIGCFLENIDNRTFVSEILDVIAQSEEHSHVLAHLTTFLKIEEKDIHRLISALRTGKAEPFQVMALGYGRVSESLPTTIISDLITALISNGVNGIWTAVFVLDMYISKRDKKRRELDDTIYMLLQSPELFTKDKPNHSEIYHLETLVESYLTIGIKKNKIAEIITHRIINVCKERSFKYDYDHFFKEILPILFKDFAEDIWSIFSQEILEGDGLSEFHLRNLLGGRDRDKTNIGPLFLMDQGVIKDWCVSNPDIAPHFILRSAPLLEKNEDEILKFSAIVEFIIDHFGTDETILSELSASMGTYSWCGSLIPYYQQYLPLLDKFSNHKINKVKEWAVRQLTWYKEQIAEEEKREAERELGIY